MNELKDIKQIGTPREDNRIYIENLTYNKIKEESYLEKRVFVLMGHTERMGSRYATFVEAAIPVREIGFSGNVPKWDNGVWSEVFREIKRLYEELIIVGWAIDVKGRAFTLTPDLERVHKEHFGGTHQLLFLLDTLEGEETFYIYKENKVVSKDGYYIYHKARSRERIPITVLPEKVVEKRHKESEVEVEVEVESQGVPRSGRYRQLVMEEKKPKRDGGNIGIAIAVAMLVFVVGVSVYENSNLFKDKDSIETNLLQNQESTESETEMTEDKIEVEVIPGTE